MHIIKVVIYMFISIDIKKNKSSMDNKYDNILYNIWFRSYKNRDKYLATLAVVSNQNTLH